MQDLSRKLASFFWGSSTPQNDIITRNSTLEQSATGFDHMLSRMAVLAARVSHLRTSHTGPTSSSGVEYSRFSWFLLSISLFIYTPHSCMYYFNYTLMYIYIIVCFRSIFWYSYIYIYYTRSFKTDNKYFIDKFFVISRRKV